MFKTLFGFWHLIGLYSFQRFNFIHENIYRNDTLGHFVGALLAPCHNCFIALPANLVDIIAFPFAWIWGNPYPFYDICLIYVAFYSFTLM